MKNAQKITHKILEKIDENNKNYIDESLCA